MSEVPSAEKDAGRPCYRCGKDPAEGYASVWTATTGERWYCHGDDDESPTCYEGANIVDPDAFGAAGYLLTPRDLPPAETRAESDPHATNGRVPTAQTADGNST